MKFFAIFAAAALVAAPALAQGDAEAGEREFRACAACHVIEDPSGELIAGRGARTGPNLYGVVGRTAGTVEDFRYGDSLIAAGEAGLVWDAEQLAAYIPNATEFLREYLDDSSARSRGMSNQRVRNMDDLIAFLTLHSPDAE